MDKLKPCPFCGGDAVFSRKSYVMGNSTRGWVFTVRCSKCGIELPNANYRLEISLEDSGEIEMVTDEIQQAIKDWNRRVGPLSGVAGWAI